MRRARIVFAFVSFALAPACGSSSPPPSKSDGGLPPGGDSGSPDSGDAAVDAAGLEGGAEDAGDDGSTAACSALCASPGEDVCQNNTGYICVGQPGGCLTLSPIDVCSSDETCFEGECTCGPTPCIAAGNACTASTLVSCTMASDGCLVAASTTPCTTTMGNAIPSCAAGACSFACNPGYLLSGASCTAVPQLVAPLSTARVTSTTPTLHWTLPSGADGASVDVCRDRACATILTTLAAVGTSVRLSSALSPGAYFWRARGTSGGTAVTQNSVTWEFWVGWPGDSADTSWGTILDVNGDGFADVAVADLGSVAIYSGSVSGLSLSSGALPPIDANLIVNAGDVNGDGFADVLASTNQNSAVLLFLGGASGLAVQPVAELAGNATDVAAALYDSNHDGFADVALGYRLDEKPPASRVDVYTGSPASLAAKPAVSLAVAGTLEAIAGCDVNGDGAGDLAVAADGASSAAVSVFLGGATGLATTTAATLAPSSADHQFGATIACAGDVNADGFEDLLVGDPGVAGGGVFLYLGSATGVSSVPSALSSTGGTLFGQALAGAGDVNGDGFDDALVGAGGTIYVLSGSATGLSVTNAASFAMLGLDAGATSHFGAVLAAAGDINGDGYADVAAGALLKPYGDVLIYLGSGAGISTNGTEIPLPVDAGAGFGVIVAGADDRRAR